MSKQIASSSSAADNPDMKEKATVAQRRWNRQQPNNEYLADASRPLPPAPAENQGTIKHTVRDKSGAFAKPKARGGAIHQVGDNIQVLEADDGRLIPGDEPEA